MKTLPASLALAALILIPGIARAADTYEVDPVHSAILARVQHMGAGHCWGRFNEFKGTFVLDEADASKSSLSIEVAAGSVDTANKKRDEHLKGPDFFNAVQFPLITFKSTSLKKLDETTYEAAGDFTCHGVTKPLAAKITVVGKGKGPRGETRLGADTTFELKRSEFGIVTEGLGETVLILASIEGIQK
jgi:polyisoprenoid-binding protein YceI